METPRAAAPPASEPPAHSFGDVIRRLGPLSVLALISAALPGIGGFLLLAYRQPFAEWLQSHADAGLYAYVAFFIVTAGLALLPTYAQAILGGFVFQFARGFPAALGGFVGAAVLGYAVAWLASGDRALRLIQENRQARAIYEALIGRGFWRALGIVTLIRVPPNSPFAATNLLLAATKTSFPAYVLGTVIGMAPRTAAAVYIGSQLQALDQPDKPTWFFWGGLVISLAVLGIIGALLNQVVARVGGWDDAQRNGAPR